MRVNVLVFESVASESSSSEKLVGERPPPAENEKSCGSLGRESSTITIEPRLRSVKVHVTVSETATSMFETGLPSLQVALDWSHPLGSAADSEYRALGVRLEKVLVLESVPSESSSSEKLVGERPPPAVKAKSCGSFGCESRTATTEPGRWFVNVQVTASPGATSMLPTELPSLQLLEVTQP